MEFCSIICWVVCFISCWLKKICLVYARVISLHGVLYSRLYNCTNTSNKSVNLDWSIVLPNLWHRPRRHHRDLLLPPPCSCPTAKRVIFIGRITMYFGGFRGLALCNPRNKFLHTYLPTAMYRYFPWLLLFSIRQRRWRRQLYEVQGHVSMPFSCLYRLTSSSSFVHFTMVTRSSP